MRTRLKDCVNLVLAKVGYEIRRFHDRNLEPETAHLISRVRPFSMTSQLRIEALHDAVQHVSRAGVNGAMVECGVWKGGSAMAMALTLLAEGDLRDIYLYDTFEGMSEPTAEDRDYLGRSGADLLAQASPKDRMWANAGLDEPVANMAATGYPMDRVRFIKGPVEETIPDQMPESIAVLRLDTDWYKSTLHELQHLYPQLSSGGVLIVDDYGHFDGARQAVDEYMATLERPLFLWKIDYTGRMAIKP